MVMKRLVAGIASALLIGALSISPLIANAANYPYTRTANVFTYKENCAKTYSRNNASTGWTGIAPTSYGSSVGYDVSYKEVSYQEFKDYNGWYQLTYKNVNSGTNKVVTTNTNHKIATTTVKRLHTTKMHYGSNSDSKVVEQITIEVVKPD